MKVRDVFFNNVYEKVRQGEDIVIVSSDIGAPSLDKFREVYPERFVNVGIAEQNVISVAGGLSLAGKKVITYGLNPFVVTRAFDHIRNIMNSLKIPVTISALNAGSSSVEAGYSHNAIENMTIMRTLDNIKLINLSDEIMAKKVVEEILSNPCPRYIQFDKYIEGIIYQKEEIDFSKGFIISGYKESDVLVVSYGIGVVEIQNLDMRVKLMDCFSIPIDEKSFIEEVLNIKKIVTVEDSVAQGGLGSMILEILNDNKIFIPVERIALKSEYPLPSDFVNRKMFCEYKGTGSNDIRKVIEKIGEE